MSRVVLLALLAVGCGRQLNPEYCAMNPDDVDCRTAGLAMVDAPVGCPTIACSDQKLPVCEVSTGNCVQCLPAGTMGSDPAQCPTDQVCGQDRMCHACLVDTDCKDSKVCLSDGTCALVGNVLYAAPAPAGMGTACTLVPDAPCTFSTAVSQLGMNGKTIVKLTTTKGTDYSEPPVVVGASGTIIGTGATFTPTGPGPGISFTKQTNVEIVGLTIQSATDEGIVCSETSFQLRRATIVGSGSFGVRTTKCDATIERTKLLRNVGGAMSLAEGLFEVRNNMVGPDNGNGALVDGNIRLDKARGRVVFNTVALNKAKTAGGENEDGEGGGKQVGGLKCTGSATLLVAHNILADNSSDELNGDCQQYSNYTSNTITLAHFAGPTDFHLTMMSPTSDPVIRDDPDADRSTTPPLFDCRPPNADAMSPYLDDFDGQARPYLFCDRGADEYRP